MNASPANPGYDRLLLITEQLLAGRPRPGKHVVFSADVPPPVGSTVPSFGDVEIRPSGGWEDRS